MRIKLQPYVTNHAASRLTYMSVRKLRRGCEDGTIPHIRSNGRYYVDLPALRDRLDAEHHGDIRCKSVGKS